MLIPKNQLIYDVPMTDYDTRTQSSWLFSGSCSLRRTGRTVFYFLVLTGNYRRSQKMKVWI